jgi:RimJ/RimL family protein N-acetyltransferase
VSEQRWTDRLFLRRPVEQDAAEIAVLTGDPESPAAFLADWAGDGMGCWAVERNGLIIGLAGLRFMTFHLRDSWDLYACFAPIAWGRGYAIEAVEEALAVALEQSARLPVVARTAPENAHGFALAERAGLTRRKDLDRDGLEVHVSHW